jgi:ribosomal protein S12 methylthiotransferase
MISLGCSKNLVDTEMFLGLVTKYDIQIVNNIKDADILVVNTCGFIEKAKKEALDTIFELIEYKHQGKVIIAMGCLVERYFDQLKKEIPEVDYFIPIRNYDKLGELLSHLSNSQKNFSLDPLSRLLTTPAHSAYIKIAEGCNNRCAFCAIPLIRGNFRSRKPNEIVEEARRLAQKGVKEITLISQDTTRYGSDLSPKYPLEHLLNDLASIDGLKMIRFLYLYPDEITDGLIETVRYNPKIAPYFDIPLQHASDKLLRAMLRRGNLKDIYALIHKLRNRIPNVILRTTLITGFPGETEEDFEQLANFVRDVKFDRLGVFSYSEEEDTLAARLPDKVDEATKEKRARIIAEIQSGISKQKNEALIGRDFEVLIDGYDESKNVFLARSFAFAPDDVDGYIYINYDKDIKVGEFFKAEITKASTYDLYGKIIK